MTGSKTSTTQSLTGAFTGFCSCKTCIHYFHVNKMIPIDRFNLDRGRVKFLTDDQYTEEVFFVEENRTVSKTNVFSINSHKYECPVDLRGKVIQVRYDRRNRNRFIVYFSDKRMGDASLLDLHFNANQRKPNLSK